MFNYAVLTTKGKEMINSAIAGSQLIFTRMEYGAGIPSGFNPSKTEEENKAILAARTSLVGSLADIQMYKKIKGNNYIELIGVVNVDSISQDFLGREVGVFGMFPGDSKDYLLAYFIATDDPVKISKADLQGQNHRVRVKIATGNAANITVNYTPGIFVEVSDFQAEVERIDGDIQTNVEQINTELDTLAQDHAADISSLANTLGTTIMDVDYGRFKFTQVIDSNEDLLLWANADETKDWSSVLIKKGEYTLTGKMINLSSANTKLVVAEQGATITVGNYHRGIGATEDYGAVVVGLNVILNSSGEYQTQSAFYRGMICYNCTGTCNGRGTDMWGQGFDYCTCINCTGNGNNGTGAGSNTSGAGFVHCTCSNCVGTGVGYAVGIGFLYSKCSNCTGNGTGNLNGTGFSFCTCSNCTGTGNGNAGGTGFSSCTCSNCVGEGTATLVHEGIGHGFSFCTCSNCTGTGSGASAGYGFRECTCSNCTGTGTGGSAGYVFYQCKHCSSCRAEKTTSTTATWGGTNTYIDSDSCDYVA